MQGGRSLSSGVVDRKLKRPPRMPSVANVKNEKNTLANRKAWGAGILNKNNNRIPSAISKKSNIQNRSNYTKLHKWNPKKAHSRKLYRQK